MVDADLKALGLVPLSGHTIKPIADIATVRQPVSPA